jgi:phage tail-like protein
MARAILEDKFHNYSFQIIVGDNMVPSGGFTACALPEFMIDAVEYRSGDKSTLKEKYPAMATIASNLILTRGLVLKDSELGKWALKWSKGETYRTDITILHFHGSKGNARKYTLFNAFPIRWKSAADLDAGASDVTMQELELVYEGFKIEETSDDQPVRLEDINQY